MKSLIILYKPVGLTPLQAIQKFKQQNPKYKNLSISHAGRLDPIAEGLLPLVIGNETKNLKRYLKLDKEYRAKILFGFSTDTYDILGIPEKSSNQKINLPTLKKQIKLLKGPYLQTLPPYSSRKIKGKTLLYYTRNKIPIKTPKQTIIIKQIKINSIYTTTNNRLLKEITKKINLLKGDFRQIIIIKNWNLLLKKQEKYIIADITLTVTSGTYIRAIANDLGKRLNTKAVLLNLRRIRVGKLSTKTIKLKKEDEKR